MKSYHILLLALIVVDISCASFFKNTTIFWAQKLNRTTIDFQCYVGYQEIDWYYPPQTSGMFYSLFGAMGHSIWNTTNYAPLFIWLQGGPGSSSQFGAFTEIGPIRIQNGTAKLFPYSWNYMGHLLFIDSPLNVGFSFQGKDRTGKNQVSTTEDAAKHLLNFLFRFFHGASTTVFRNSPVYIIGESFAGHYIPELAEQILSNQSFLRNTGMKLVGISIGDGWTDPINQVNYYDSYLWSVGVVEQTFRDVCSWYQTHAIINIFDERYQNATNYFDFLTNNDTTPQKYMGNISIYNFRNYNGLDESYAKILNDSKEAFNVSVDFIPGNDAIYTAFGPDISKSYAKRVVDVLRRIKVLIYNGQNDVVVNNPGVMQYLNRLNWEGIQQWKRTQKQKWTNYGQVRGWAKVSGNLWYVHVNGAGHMVPTDQPAAASNMFGHFLFDEKHWTQ